VVKAPSGSTPRGGPIFRTFGRADARTSAAGGGAHGCDDVPPADVESVKRGTEQVRIATGMADFWRYCEALADDRRAVARRATRQSARCMTCSPTYPAVGCRNASGTVASTRKPRDRQSATAPVFVSTTALNCMAR
jgi:hypothetical protein